MNPFAWSQSLMRFSMSSTIAVSLGLQSLQLPGSGLLCMARRLASALTRFLARINNSAVRLPLAALLISFLAAVRRWLMSAGMRPLGQSGVKSSSTAQLTESKELAVSGSYTHSCADPWRGTQWPRVQVAPLVHGIGVFVQRPLSASHRSSVHGLPSSQGGIPGTQVPVWQVTALQTSAPQSSSVLQQPSIIRHLPVGGSQNDVQHLQVQAGGFPGIHSPSLLHVSTPLHLSSSSHEAPLGSLVSSQRPPPSVRRTPGRAGKHLAMLTHGLLMTAHCASDVQQFCIGTLLQP